jgi:hypothetical protein
MLTATSPQDLVPSGSRMPPHRRPPGHSTRRASLAVRSRAAAVARGSCTRPQSRPQPQPPVGEQVVARILPPSRPRLCRPCPRPASVAPAPARRERARPCGRAPSAGSGGDPRDTRGAEWGPSPLGHIAPLAGAPPAQGDDAPPRACPGRLAAAAGSQRRDRLLAVAGGRGDQRQSGPREPYQPLAGRHGHSPLSPLDLYPPAISRPPPLAKSRATATAPRLKTWTTRGRPFLPQFDNESTFGGGPTPARGLGLIGRWCRYGQSAPFCPPGYEATRPHQLEPFPSLWVASFWARQQFAAWAQVQAELPLLLRGYRTAYPPPARAGRPPAPRRRGFHPPPAPRLAALEPRAALAADCRTASSSAPGRPAGHGDLAQRGLAAGQPLDGRIWASDHRYGSAAGELLGQTRGQDSVALSQAAPGSVAGKCP